MLHVDYVYVCTFAIVFEYVRVCEIIYDTRFLYERECVCVCVCV